MRTRLFILSAAIVALAVGSAHAGSPFGFFPTCGSGKNSQCAFQFVTGNNNVARIDQASSKRKSFQLGLNLQKGNSNRSYIGQSGGNQVAVTAQDGNNNASYTYQEGTNQLSVTVQSGNGHWAGVSSYNTTNGVAVTSVIQTN